jgi:hypothetical protein
MGVRVGAPYSRQQLRRGPRVLQHLRPYQFVLEFTPRKLEHRFSAENGKEILAQQSFGFSSALLHGEHLVDVLLDQITDSISGLLLRDPLSRSFCPLLTFFKLRIFPLVALKPLFQCCIACLRQCERNNITQPDLAERASCAR